MDAIDSITALTAGSVRIAEQMKTQEVSSSMATEDLQQAVLAARLLTNTLGSIPSDRRVRIEVQYKLIFIKEDSIMSNSTTNGGCCGGSTTSGNCHHHDISIPAHTHSIGNAIIDGLCAGMADGERAWHQSTYMRPFKVFEEECKKIHIFRVPGFNKVNLDVRENWNNKEKAMKIEVYGRQYIGRDDEIVNISLYLDHEVYDKYEVRIIDGLCYVIFYEIINEAPPIMRLGLEEE